MLNPDHLNRVDLNLLLLFRVVFEEGNVARAADRLNLTPSAVSHGLRRLRKLLNDPLFLRTPKGVVPTARAETLAEPVADLLQRAQGIVASAEPFEPASSRRRFVIGAPDAVLASAVVPLLTRLDRTAPGIDLGLVHLMPGMPGPAGEHPWARSLAKLEARELDVAILPGEALPARFEGRVLFHEDFVVAMRRAHALADALTVSTFCAARHVLVSRSGEPRGFVDELLAEQGLARRVALTVPSFMMALAQVAESDLISVLPRRLVERYARIFGLTQAELPLRRDADAMMAVATKAAMQDAGIAWLLDILANETRRR